MDEEKLKQETAEETETPEEEKKEPEAAAAGTPETEETAPEKERKFGRKKEGELKKKLEALKAETEAGERLNGLVAEQEELEKEVAALKQTAAEYRRQFEELLRAQQEALEKATGLF